MLYREIVDILKEKTGEDFSAYKIAGLLGTKEGTMYKRKKRNSRFPDRDIKILETKLNLKIL